MLPTSYRRENAKTENEAEEDMLLVPTYLTKKKNLHFPFLLLLPADHAQPSLHAHTYIYVYTLTCMMYMSLYTQVEGRGVKLPLKKGLALPQKCQESCCPITITHIEMVV